MTLLTRSTAFLEINISLRIKDLLGDELSMSHQKRKTLVMHEILLMEETCR